jgi:spore germination protein YaaH
VYGFVPYWEMDDGIAAHLADTRLTTLGLFSVAHTRGGAINEAAKGYRAITGPVGDRLIREAHERGVRVELVYTSFGDARNERLFENVELQDSVIASLVALAGDLGMDGVNVDVEVLDPVLVPAYGAFVGRLRDALTAADPADQVSVATGAGALGAAMAAAAAGAGADRIFLMGYDYRVAGSSPGATSPLDSRTGEKDLAWSLDLYASLGVPAERTLLGLPLYGVTWPVAGPVVGAPETGRGDSWILRRHLDLLTDPAAVPERDAVEQVEVYLLGSDGSIGPPESPESPLASPSPSPATGAPSPATPAQPTPDITWQAVYVDSPATLAPKMGLARERGLAGVGFWAIGYERGLPGYTDLIGRFGAGEPLQ